MRRHHGIQAQNHIDHCQRNKRIENVPNSFELVVRELRDFSVGDAAYQESLKQDLDELQDESDVDHDDGQVEVEEAVYEEE